MQNQITHKDTCRIISHTKVHAESVLHNINQFAFFFCNVYLWIIRVSVWYFFFEINMQNHFTHTNYMQHHFTQSTCRIIFHTKCMQNHFYTQSTCKIIFTFKFSFASLRILLCRTNKSHLIVVCKLLSFPAFDLMICVRPQSQYCRQKKIFWLEFASLGK